MTTQTISVNRAPVLTLWAAVVAQRLGFDKDEALTLGKAVAGLNAQAKRHRPGMVKPHEEGAVKAREKGLGEVFWIELCGRAVPARNTEGGIRAVWGTEPIDPDSVERYLKSNFIQEMGVVRSALEKLAQAFSPEELVDEACTLYER